MALALLESSKDLNELSSVDYTMEDKGWEKFAPIHAACAHKIVPKILEFLIEKQVDMSIWGQETHHKISFAKRLPLHYAAESKHMSAELLRSLALASPEAMFAHVNDRANRNLPCQCTPHREMLEELMYQHICKSYDETEDSAGYTRLIRKALLFEKVSSLDESKLPRGRLSFVVSDLMPKKMKALETAERDFTQEVKLFAEANPRMDLGKEGATKVAVKSMESIGQLLKSDFWELLKLSKHCQEAKEQPEFEKMLYTEIQARLRWVAEVCLGQSDVIRYGIFVIAGLIADILATKKDEDASDGAVLSSVAKKVSTECLEVIVAAYCKELEIPEDWKLQEVLQEGLEGRGIKQIVFSGGDLVIKQDVSKDSLRFQWIEGLFEETFLKRYTRDRKGGKVPDSLRVHEVEQVLNCGSWGEYAMARRTVLKEVKEKGLAWSSELRTDACSKGEAATWHRSKEYAGVNEHWLYHGTSLDGERGITEGDFRLNLAGSNAGTLYGAGPSSFSKALELSDI